MHPQFRIDLLQARRRELELAARRSHLLEHGAPPAAVADEPVALRLCTVHDDPALERLARLEGRPLPQGRFLVAEVAGELVAALPLRGGPPLADPFRATAHLLPLLRLRARQLDRLSGKPRHARLALFSALRGRA